MKVKVTGLSGLILLAFALIGVHALCEKNGYRLPDLLFNQVPADRSSSENSRGGSLRYQEKLKKDSSTAADQDARFEQGELATQREAEYLREQLAEIERDNNKQLTGATFWKAKLDQYKIQVKLSQMNLEAIERIQPEQYEKRAEMIRNNAPQEMVRRQSTIAFLIEQGRQRQEALHKEAYYGISMAQGRLNQAR